MQPKAKKVVKNNQLGVYYAYVGVDSLKARQAIETLNFGDDPYLLACLAQTYRDEALFFKNGKMRKHIRNDKMMVAKKYVDKGFKIGPVCRDLLYIRGDIYRHLDRLPIAIGCYVSILEMASLQDIKHNCSRSSMSFVRMLTNDARFQLYRLFHELGDFALSEKFLISYKEYLASGVNTIYKPLDKFIMK